MTAVMSATQDRSARPRIDAVGRLGTEQTWWCMKFRALGRVIRRMPARAARPGKIRGSRQTSGLGRFSVTTQFCERPKGPSHLRIHAFANDMRRRVGPIKYEAVLRRVPAGASDRLVDQGPRAYINARLDASSDGARPLTVRGTQHERYSIGAAPLFVTAEPRTVSTPIADAAYSGCRPTCQGLLLGAIPKRLVNARCFALCAGFWTPARTRR
jgi:hypothetical protein